MSRKKIKAICDFNFSKNCKIETEIDPRNYKRTLERNNGKYKCWNCAKAITVANRTRNTFKYKSLKEDYFDRVDSREKAYILGWIASDGHITKDMGNIEIGLQRQDRDILEFISENISNGDLPVRDYMSKKQDKTFPSSRIRIHCKPLVSKVCNLLEISGGKKHELVNFPYKIPEEFYNSFWLGYFEGDGCVSITENLFSQKRAIISTSSDFIESAIKKTIKIPYQISYCTKERKKPLKNICFPGLSGLEFLDYIYRDAPFVLRRKHDLYLKFKSEAPTNG